MKSCGHTTLATPARRPHPYLPPEGGDADGKVPLDALEKHLYVYEPDYYRSLLDRAQTHASRAFGPRRTAPGGSPVRFRLGRLLGVIVGV